MREFIIGDVLMSSALWLRLTLLCSMLSPQYDLAVPSQRNDRNKSDEHTLYALIPLYAFYFPKTNTPFVSRTITSHHHTSPYSSSLLSSSSSPTTLSTIKFAPLPTLASTVPPSSTPITSLGIGLTSLKSYLCSNPCGSDPPAASR
jgi:hypothetical protein